MTPLYALLLGALSASAAPTTAPFTPFDLARGSIAVDAGHGLALGEKVVRVIIVENRPSPQIRSG